MCFGFGLGEEDVESAFDGGRDAEDGFVIVEIVGVREVFIHLCLFVDPTDSIEFQTLLK